ncbi:hypothetical protein VT84_33655 [Gemmata sp. SH-PL17]|uniref:hypothetical protein n=1 Tax=Gemmata sp. SH-PL17 TaxID=1630693 RepID=UPI00078EA6FF|nr:hypothetical protein [Gemmata sp. SH-PL17]AMV29389.1 hypothetical protein VT84_33655 [Gemmata sp. SH-PL17]
MKENHEVRLSPNTFDDRHKVFKLGEPEFRLAVSLVEKSGFRPNMLGGLDRRDVGPFAQHLRRALDAERVDESARRVLEGLVEFLATDHVRSRGLTIHRVWR